MSTLLLQTTPAGCVQILPPARRSLVPRPPLLSFCPASVVTSPPSASAFSAPYSLVCSQLSGQTPWGGGDGAEGWVGQVLWDLCDTNTQMEGNTHTHTCMHEEIQEERKAE